jgi:hypothetical protein
MEERQNKTGPSNPAQGNKGVAGATGLNNTAPGSNGVKKQVFHIAAPNLTMMPNIGQKIEGAIFVHGVGANDLDLHTPESVNIADVKNSVVDGVHKSEGENNLAIENIPGRVEQLAAIPEASPAKAASCWSKRRARDTNEDFLECATKLKVHRNEGENISDSCICSNLSCVGISIGQEKDSIDASIAVLREATENSMPSVCNKKMLILESELKDIKQEEDLDKILLNQLCGELMDEVMDMG